ncbi:MAG: hypothetical protein ACRDRT_05890 [Pseudonocardiaceae bacterium]
MGSVEQDLRAHQREVDRTADEDRASERAADELQGEIWQNPDDLETLMFEAVEHGDFPFAPLARMLTLQAHTDDSREFIRRLRISIDPRLQEMVTSRTAARVQSWRDEAEEARAEAALESRDSNL